MEREKYGKEHRDNGAKREERYREMQRNMADGMGQMERGHTSEVQPTDVTREYVRGISRKHIETNAVVFMVTQMIQRGELKEKEGLYLMVNLLADENAKTHEMCNELLMRMPSRLLVEKISGKN